MRELRNDRNLSLAQLSVRSGLSKPLLSQIERGRMVASDEDLRQIEVGLSVSRLANKVVPCVEVPAA